MIREKTFLPYELSSVIFYIIYQQTAFWKSNFMLKMHPQKPLSFVLLGDPARFAPDCDKNIVKTEKLACRIFG